MKWFGLSLLLLLSQKGLGQTARIAHWFFGFQAGIDFSTGAPQADVTGNLSTIEGSSTMSDPAGHLLCYSDGQNVYNKNNAVMPNGANLTGDQSSTQSSLIVPVPGSDHLYYLFTTLASSYGPNGFYYNVIDMNLDGGLGDVTTKNVQLFSEGTEQLAGTFACDGINYWIVSRQQAAGVLKFYAYELTNSGLSAPTISTIDAPESAAINTVGTLTLSPQGTRAAFTSFTSSIYLLDFNTATGSFTPQLKVFPVANESVYSNAFSPDAQKLYITSWVTGGYNYLAEYDLTATDIPASRINIDSTDYRFGSANGYGEIGQIRLAPDQRIYISRWNQDHPYQVNPATYYSLDSLDAILNPDGYGLACGHQRDYLYLKGRPAMLGLPTFIGSYTLAAPLTSSCPVIVPSVSFTDTGQCTGASIGFNYTGSTPVDGLEWNFGDPASGAHNISSLPNPVHLYSAEGQYQVSLTVSYPGGTVTTDSLIDAGKPAVGLGPDTVLCAHDSLILRLPAGATDITWQDFSHGSSYTVHYPGLYGVKLLRYGCPVADTIRVGYLSPPVFSKRLDTSICAGETVVLAPVMADTSGIRYLWQNGSVQPEIAVTKPGTYVVIASNSCGLTADSIEVAASFCDLYMPSAFTPNDDGHNDRFHAIAGPGITAFDLTVYNRWGQKVFESDNAAIGWDGYCHGVRQPPGAYVWILTYTSSTSGSHLLKGTVLLVL